MTYKGQIPRARILTTFFVTLLIMNPIHGYMFLKPVQVGLGRCLDDNFVPHMVGDTWYDDKKCEMLTCMYIEGLLYISGYGCGRIGYSPECRIIKRKGHYPVCCPIGKCND
ncbi:U-scoloptoxin(16)-Er12a-like isoform X1 [Tachypleus tridentatus]|uniref:U-scoloptoxin(16)-Er12a-like isoform X1 n=1 Tax=Tachypleus tridentatus TaxID=6853 RepID=UPI003FD0AFEF